MPTGQDMDEVDLVLALSATLQDAPAPMSQLPPEVQASSHAGADAEARAALCGNAVGPVAYDYIARCTAHFSPSRAIGKGAYGTVFWAVDDSERTSAALEFAAKRLECDDAEDRKALERMTEAEIQTLTRFSHPHIIRLLGFCRSQAASILLYEYEPLGSLDSHLVDVEKATRLLWPYRVRIVAGVVTAVSYLHMHDPQGPCYHRDIKPGNIVLTPTLAPKLIDCGLSRFLPNDRPEVGSRKTLKGTTGIGALGTPGFMCPRYISTNSFDAKSEVYAVGVTILQVITGTMDFTSPSSTSEMSLNDLVDEGDETRATVIASDRDQRPPSDAAGSSVQSLAEMAAACVAKYKSRVSLIALLRQAKQAAAALPVHSEVDALRAEVERMAAELRHLRIQGELAQQQELAALKTCELCYDNISPSRSGGMSCPLGHFVCAGCAPAMVMAYLQQVTGSDTLLEEHRVRGGHIACFRATAAFDPRCTTIYADSMLASTLPESVFVRYRQVQDSVVEQRIWQEHNDRFLREVARIKAEHGRDTQRLDEQASADFLRRQYPNARMCPRCNFGPVINENCADLAAHHGEARAGGRSRISNACGQCGFFTRDWNQWLLWDGVLRTGSRQ